MGLWFPRTTSRKHSGCTQGTSGGGRTSSRLLACQRPPVLQHCPDGQRGLLTVRISEIYVVLGFLFGLLRIRDGDGTGTLPDHGFWRRGGGFRHCRTRRAGRRRDLGRRDDDWGGGRGGCRDRCGGGGNGRSRVNGLTGEQEAPSAD